MEFQNYIGGEWVPGRSGRTFNTINPANEEVPTKIVAADTKDLDEAICKSKASYHSWCLTTAPVRGGILYRIGGLLKEPKEDLARLMNREIRLMQRDPQSSYE